MSLLTSGICPICKGVGHYNVRTEDSNDSGEVMIEHKWCGTCNGTGHVDNQEDIDARYVFDLGDEDDD